MNRIGTGKLRDLNDQIILKLLLRHQEVTKKELANYSSTSLTHSLLYDKNVFWATDKKRIFNFFIFILTYS